eukprot:COSAG04_NODE_26_length_37184_cov_14.641149_11_plen_333_part_00
MVFSKPYAGDPFCRVSFENVWLHHQQDSHASGLTIRIADSNGADKPWSDVQTWMMVMCHGSTPEDACTVPPGACDCSGARPDECGVCGGSGPPEGGTCWFGPKMRTGAIVPRANADLDRSYQTSGLYCHWNGATKSFDVCPYRGMEGYATGHNFNGEANFDHAVVEVSGNALRVDFVKPYAGEPLCWVSFENEWVHHRMDTFTLGVRIFLANTDGTDRDWSTVTSYMQIVCHGSGLDRVYSGSFGMPSGIVVPSANSDLDKAFQLSGIYCHWSGSQNKFDDCPTAHSWSGVANMAVADAAADGVGLTVPFQVPYTPALSCVHTTSSHSRRCC